MWGQYWDGRHTKAYPSWTGIKADGKRSWMTETSGEVGSDSKILCRMIHIKKCRSEFYYS